MKNIEKFMQELQKMKSIALKVKGGGLYASGLDDAIKTAERLLLKDNDIEVEKLHKQVDFFKKAATNLSGGHMKMQDVICQFQKFIKEQKDLCALAMTACGTDAKSMYVHSLYNEIFRNKLKELDLEKILAE